MFGILNRRTLLLAGIASAISIPYAWNDPKVQGYVREGKQWFSKAGENLKLQNTSFAAGQRTEDGLPNPTAPPDLDSLETIDSLPTAVEGPPVQDFNEVIRFDIEPRWVTDRWSRVTTVLAEYNLEGLRVPFVSGTNLDDIAGVLTYYYDKTHQLQRITFHGYTGDERRLAAFVQEGFGLRPEQSLYAGLYMTRWNGKPKSALLVRLAPIVVSSSPHSRLELMLEINRPNHYYELSASFRQLLGHGQKNWRWGK